MAHSIEHCIFEPLIASYETFLSDYHECTAVVNIEYTQISASSLWFLRQLLEQCHSPIAEPIYRRQCHIIKDELVDPPYAQWLFDAIQAHYTKKVSISAYKQYALSSVHRYQLQHYQDYILTDALFAIVESTYQSYATLSSHDIELVSRTVMLYQDKEYLILNYHFQSDYTLFYGEYITALYNKWFEYYTSRYEELYFPFCCYRFITSDEIIIAIPKSWIEQLEQMDDKFVQVFATYYTKMLHTNKPRIIAQLLEKPTVSMSIRWQEVTLPILG